MFKLSGWNKLNWHLRWSFSDYKTYVGRNNNPLRHHINKKIKVLFSKLIAEMKAKINRFLESWEVLCIDIYSIIIIYYIIGAPWDDTEIMPCPFNFIFTPGYHEVLIFHWNNFSMQPFFRKILWLFVNKPCKTAFVRLFVFAHTPFDRILSRMHDFKSCFIWGLVMKGQIQKVRRNSIIDPQM